MINSKSLHFFIAIITAILTTGFLRLQLISGLPDFDGGFYALINQIFYHTLINAEGLKGMALHLYQMMTFWVYGLDVNQYILLRVIDGLVAITASIIFFKVILKESGSILFTVILMAPLLIAMNNVEIIFYGYANSIWASYLPLFTALLVWQKSSKADTFSFYIIGALVSLGILLREPFLPFFLLVGVSILISYGWRVLLKYLIGSAILGFSVLAVMLSLREWDLLDLINSYSQGGLAGGVTWWIWNTESNVKMVLGWALDTIKISWFICITALTSVIYLIKLYFSDKKVVSINRFYFWLVVALLPLLEWVLKLGLPYHLANCMIGLAGLSAIGWKHLNIQESKKIKKSAIIIMSLMSLTVILPTLNKTIIKSPQLYSPLNVIEWIGMIDLFRGPQTIQKSQFLIAAAKVYGLSKEDSTLAVNGFWQPVYPLTSLLPPTYKFCHLRSLFISLSYNEDKMIKAIEEYRPTLMLLSPQDSMDGAADFISMVEKTNLYNKVGEVPKNLKIDRGYLSGTIYRLKDFK